MEDGRIAEFAAPFTLLLREESLFGRLVQQTDKCELDHLIRQARAAYHEKNRKSVGAFMPMLVNGIEDGQQGSIVQKDFVINDYSGNQVKFTFSIECCQ